MTRTEDGMVVLSIEQYMLCGDILQEILEADQAEFGEDGADPETLYEIYLGQLKACGIPFEETPDNIYDVPEEFAARVAEVRNV
jgi:hypothetical protein